MNKKQRERERAKSSTGECVVRNYKGTEKGCAVAPEKAPPVSGDSPIGQGKAV